MDTNFPEGFQEKFFPISTSNIPETLHRIGNSIYVPCGMKHTVVQVPVDPSDPSKGTKDEDRYAWIACVVPFLGDDLSDEAAFLINRYSDLRAYFYSDPAAAQEMDKDSQKFKHIWAVQIMFPKVAGEYPEEYLKYREYKKRFWLLLKETMEAKGHSFDEIPKDTIFNADWMLAKAQEIGCTSEEIAVLNMQVTALTLNMIANHAQYTDFFPYEEGDLTFGE